MAKIHRQKTRMEVRIGLDDEYREPAIKALTSALSEVKALKIDQGDSNATYRKKIKESQEKADEAQATLERGKRVMRDVEIIKNFSTHKVKIKDLESGRFARGLGAIFSCSSGASGTFSYHTDHTRRPQ